MKNENHIKTSDPSFFKKMAKAYRNRDNFIFTDDAGKGINPGDSTLLDMGRQAGLSPQQWIGALSSLGLAGAGLWMMKTGVLNREPLLVGGGLFCLASFGSAAIRILTGVIPPNVSLNPQQGLEFSW